jgi:hypothetical protein
MNIQISNTAWFNPVKIFQSSKTSCSSTNGGLGCASINPSTNKSTNTDSYVSSNFSTESQKNTFGKQIISTSLLSINQYQTTDSIKSSVEFQTQNSKPSFTAKQFSLAVNSTSTEQLIGKNINITL